MYHCKCKYHIYIYMIITLFVCCIHIIHYVYMILTIRFPLVHMIYTNRFLVQLETQRENCCRLRSYTSICIHTHAYAHRHRHGQTRTQIQTHTYTPPHTPPHGERVAVDCNYIWGAYDVYAP